MDSQENNDSDEEEYYVYIDFESNLTSIETDNQNLDIKIIGIDSEYPIMDLNGKIFKGSYDFSYSTNVFFEQDLNISHLEPIYEKIPEKYYKFVGKTNKQITMKRIFLEPQNDKNNEKEIDNVKIEKLKDFLELKGTYPEALNLLLPPGKDPPRKIHESGDSAVESMHLENLIEPSKRQTRQKKSNNSRALPNLENAEEVRAYMEDCNDDEFKDPDYDPSQETSE